MKLQLSDHFSYKNLIRFSLSPISTMIFVSLYGIVDGFFVSNYVGSTGFAGLNLVYPFIMLIAGVGFMFGSGGCALVSMHLGRQEPEKANRYFSMIVYTTAIIGVVLSTIGFVFAPIISILLGASEAMLPYCTVYLRISMVGLTFFMLQHLFQSFLIATEKQHLGFRITLIVGCTNMLLDWLFVGIFGFGIEGAAFATIISQAIGGTVPFVLFVKCRDWKISLCKTTFEPQIVIKACSNGMSEFLSSASASIVGFLFNLQLMKYAGEHGVSAYGVIMYLSFVFVAIYIGYTMGVSPIISYNDGARNTDELKSLYKKSLVMLLITNLTMTLLAEVTAVPLAKLFVGYDDSLFELTVKGMRIYSVAFLFMGFNIFGSAFFTALNNGVVSAILSVSRTFVLELIMIYVLPLFLGVDGLWAVVIAVEGVGLIMTTVFLMKYGKRYGYRKDRSERANLLEN